MDKKKLSKIIATEIIPNQILKEDLFLFLPQNNRIIRLRQSGQFIESHVLQNYLSKGLNEFYITKEQQNTTELSESGIPEKTSANASSIDESNTNNSTGLSKSPTLADNTVTQTSLEEPAANDSSIITKQKNDINSSEILNIKKDTDEILIEKKSKEFFQEEDIPTQKRKRAEEEENLDSLTKTSKKMDPTIEDFSDKKRKINPEELIEDNHKVKNLNEDANFTENKLADDSVENDKIISLSKTDIEQNDTINFNADAPEEEVLTKFSQSTDEEPVAKINTSPQLEEEINIISGASSQEALEEIHVKGSSINEEKKNTLVKGKRENKKEEPFVFGAKNKLQPQTLAFVKKITPLPQEESNPKNIKKLMKENGTIDNFKKLKLAKELSSSLSSALSSGDTKQALSLKKDLTSLMKSETIPATLLKSFPELNDEETILPFDSNSSDPIDSKTIAVIVEKEMESLLNEVDENLTSFEKTIEAETNSLPINTNATSLNKKTILDKEDTEELLNSLSSIGEDQNPTINKDVKEKIQNKLKTMEAKKEITSQIKTIQETIVEVTKNEKNPEIVKEKVFAFAQELDSLQKDLIKVSQGKNTNSLENWAVKSSNAKENSIDNDSVQEIKEKIQKLETEVEENVFKITSNDKNIQDSMVERKIKGDQSAELSSYTAILALSQGYTNRDFLKELQVVNLFLSSQSKDSSRLPRFSQLLLQHLEKPSSENLIDISLNDAIQVIKLAREYMQIPAYTSGKLKIDKQLFQDFCAELEQNNNYYDPVLIERAKQYINRDVSNDTVVYCKDICYEAKAIVKNALL